MDIGVKFGKLSITTPRHRGFIKIKETTSLPRQPRRCHQLFSIWQLGGCMSLLQVFPGEGWFTEMVCCVRPDFCFDGDGETEIG